MTKELKQQNIEITPAQQAWYGKNFKSVRAGITTATDAFMRGLEKNPVAAMFPDLEQAHDFMMQSWRHIWRHTLVMLKGRFTAGELSLIIDCHNAHAMTPMMYGSAGLLHNVSDAIALDGLAEKWMVDEKEIKAKLAELSAIQAHCLEIFATGFWYGKKRAQGLEDYIKPLL